jgi:6-phosphofructokinase 1
MGSLLVGQSGGPTAVINATVYGVLKEGLKHPEITHLYGAIHGIDGVINENLFEVTKETNLENWQTTPGAILGSVRLRLKKYPEDLELYNKILEVFKKYDIE